MNSHIATTPPQSATTPGSTAPTAIRTTVETPGTPSNSDMASIEAVVDNGNGNNGNDTYTHPEMLNASSVSDGSGNPDLHHPSSTAPAAITTSTPQQTLHIPYKKPPVSKGMATSKRASSRTRGGGAPRPLDHAAETVQSLVEPYLHNVPQQSHMYEAIALVASLANGGSAGLTSMSSAELSASISRVCASMNKDLLLRDEDGRKSELAVIESLAALAIGAVYNGRQDHWHILMRGLRDIIDHKGGIDAEWGDMVNKIRK